MGKFDWVWVGWVGKFYQRAWVSGQILPLGLVTMGQSYWVWVGWVGKFYNRA